MVRRSHPLPLFWPPLSFVSTFPIAPPLPALFTPRTIRTVCPGSVPCRCFPTPTVIRRDLLPTHSNAIWASNSICWRRRASIASLLCCIFLAKISSLSSRLSGFEFCIIDLLRGREQLHPNWCRLCHWWTHRVAVRLEPVGDVRGRLHPVFEWTSKLRGIKYWFVPSWDCFRLACCHYSN